MGWIVRTPARLVDAVKAHLIVVPVGECGELIARGAVRIGDRIGRMAEMVTVGDEISVEPMAIAEIALVVDDTPVVVVEDTDRYVIVDKPHGLHVHPIGPYRDGTLLNRVLAHAGATRDQPWAAWRPHPAHRLDRAAGGLVMFAKSAAAHDELRLGFESHRIVRRYHATVIGRVQDDRGTIDAPLGRDPANDYRRAVVATGQRAVTHYTVVRRAAETTLLACVLETGRTHQIRAHLASIGHPIVGDSLYTDAAVPSSTIALRAIAIEIDQCDTRATICDP